MEISSSRSSRATSFVLGWDADGDYVTLAETTNSCNIERTVEGLFVTPSTLTASTTHLAGCSGTYAALPPNEVPSASTVQQPGQNGAERSRKRIAPRAPKTL
jgi:hypothetical protein